MGHGKLISAAIGVGAWLIAAALNILHGPQLLGWGFLALGTGLVITAVLWWIHGPFRPSASVPQATSLDVSVGFEMGMSMMPHLPADDPRAGGFSDGAVVFSHVRITNREDKDMTLGLRLLY